MQRLRGVRKSQLLEIASAARRARRQMIAQVEPEEASDTLVKRLRRETTAANAARREAARRYAVRQG